jgi:phosphoserine phosphatase RsbU/P
MFRILCVPGEHWEHHPRLLTLKRQLMGEGYALLHDPVPEPKADDSGTEADHNPSEPPPDLVLMDLMACEAPADDLDSVSFALCERLKSRSETENIPVVFLCGGHANNEAALEPLILRAFDAGAMDVIPLEHRSDAETLARVKAALRNQRAASQAVTLARQLDQMNAELYERNLQVEKELYIARQLQQSLLPPFLPDVVPEGQEASPLSEGDAEAPMRFAKYHYRDDRLVISGIYLPCDALGGDLYDVIAFPDGTVGVSIADVSGHGVPAGFITAIFKSSFYRITHAHGVPDEILFYLNNELADIVKTGDYVTALYTRLQYHDDKLVMEYSGAGHPYPLYYQAKNGTVERLQANGTPLVWVKNMEYPLGQLVLEPGDKILLFTDGLTEMRNPVGELYGEDALDRIFLELVQQNPTNLLDNMVRSLSDFAEGHPMEDDLSIVLIEAK